jgi:hypothetical protein
MRLCQVAVSAFIYSLPRMFRLVSRTHAKELAKTSHSPEFCVVGTVGRFWGMLLLR